MQQTLLTRLFGAYFMASRLSWLTEMTKTLIVVVTYKWFIKQNFEELANNVKSMHP